MARKEATACATVSSSMAARRAHVTAHHPTAIPRLPVLTSPDRCKWVYRLSPCMPNMAMQKYSTCITHTLPLAHMARSTLIKASCKASKVACIFFWGVCACARVRLIRTVANQSVSIHLWLQLHPVQHPSDAGITAAEDVLHCWRQHRRRQQMLHSFFLVPLTRQRKEYILPITGLRTINFIKYTYLTTSCSVLGWGDYRQTGRNVGKQGKE